MKVLQVGSKSIHVSSYITALGDRHEQQLLAEEPCDFDGIRKEWLVSFRSMNPLSVWKSMRRLKEILREAAPDVLHIHQVNRLAFFVTRAAAQLKIPVVTTAWGSDVLLVPKQNAFFRFLVRKSLQRSAFVTADSQEMIAAMQQLVPDTAKYVWLQYGISLVEAGEKERLIYSNRLHKPLYRVAQIVDYFQAFAQLHTDWKLAIAADGTETPQLKEQVNALGLGEKVLFAGWLTSEENRAWYRKAAIYVSIPESDGTSVSVLEAMSAGCIPVLSDLAVSREWIEDGVNGVIESAGENPLLKALTLDAARAAEINARLVAEKAERSACIAVFNRLYAQLAHGK